MRRSLAHRSARTTHSPTHTHPHTARRSTEVACRSPQTVDVPHAASAAAVTTDTAGLRMAMLCLCVCGSVGMQRRQRCRRLSACVRVYCARCGALWMAGASLSSQHNARHSRLIAPAAPCQDHRTPRHTPLRTRPPPHPSTHGVSSFAHHTPCRAHRTARHITRRAKLTAPHTTRRVELAAHHTAYQLAAHYTACQARRTPYTRQASAL